MTREELRDYVEEQRNLDVIPYHVYSTLVDGIDTLEQGPFNGMTNGDALISLYPNLKYSINISDGRVVTTIGAASSFDLKWWNAPYNIEK